MAEAFIATEKPVRVLVVMPDGARVWPDPDYDQYEDDRSLFAMSVKGVGEHGQRVTVRGNHIARVERVSVMPVRVVA